eukprot:11222585-Lingulodinium_polyedra.AAC.1
MSCVRSGRAATARSVRRSGLIAAFGAMAPLQLVICLPRALPCLQLGPPGWHPARLYSSRPAGSSGE